MNAIYILVGIGLIVCGVIAWILRKRKKAPQTISSSQDSDFSHIQVSVRRNPPELPERRRKRGSMTMPPRRDSETAVRATQTARIRYSAQNGPHGVKPEQFPWCPVCGKHNEAGSDQVIFWFQNEQFYKCSGGHKMAGNGKLI